MERSQVLGMVLHLSLVTVVTVHVCFVNTKFAGFSRAMGRNWCNLFYPPRYTDHLVSEATSASAYWVFTVEDTTSDAQRLVTSYHGLPDEAVNAVEVNTCTGLPTDQGALACPELTVTNNDGSTQSYPLRNATSGWPLAAQEAANTDAVRDFLNSVERLDFAFQVRADSQGAHKLCWDWRVRFSYDLSSHGQFQVSNDFHPMRACSLPSASDPEQVLSAIEVLTAVAFLATVLFNAWQRVQAAAAAASSPPHLSGKAWLVHGAHAVNLWFVLSLVGATCTLSATAFVLDQSVSIDAVGWLKVCMGLACLTLWTSLVQFLEFNPRYFVLVLTLRTAVPRVGRFLLGVSPIFFGYLLLGMTAFGDRCSTFGGLGQTAATLFAVVNGDVILDTFDELEIMNPLGHLYVYVYLLIFTYVVLMTVIAIVEEAFFSSSRAATVAAEGGDPDAAGGLGEYQHPLLKADDSIFEVMDRNPADPPPATLPA